MALSHVLWLSRGRVFTRVPELKMEIITFLREEENKLCGEFEIHNFTASLAYLADVFSHLNDMNISL